MFRVVSVLSTSRTTNNTYVVGVKNDFFICIVTCSRRTLTPWIAEPQEVGANELRTNNCDSSWRTLVFRYRHSPRINDRLLRVSPKYSSHFWETRSCNTIPRCATHSYQVDRIFESTKQNRKKNVLFKNKWELLRFEIRYLIIESIFRFNYSSYFVEPVCVACRVDYSPDLISLQIVLVSQYRIQVFKTKVIFGWNTYHLSFFFV